MIDIERQVVYWRDGAREDIRVAEQLVTSGNALHGLFFAHLALEKALKAHVCRRTNDLAPRTHNLARLAEISAVRFTEEQREVLLDMNAFNVEGRYPAMDLLPLTPTEAEAFLERTREVIEWLMTQL